MLKEFKDFALKGNMLDMAVGIIIGGAFGTIISSLVKDIIMPPIGLMMGGVDFAEQFLLLRVGDTPPPYLSIDAAREAGAVTMNYGLFFTRSSALLSLRSPYSCSFGSTIG
jgi:large conductance mechanosensitive channel